MRGDVTVGGIESDRLYRIEQQQELTRLLPGETGMTVIQSSAGHDGFLLEIEQIGDLVARAMSR